MHQGSQMEGGARAIHGVGLHDLEATVKSHVFDIPIPSTRVSYLSLFGCVNHRITQGQQSPVFMGYWWIF